MFLFYNNYNNWREWENTCTHHIIDQYGKLQGEGYV